MNGEKNPIPKANNTVIPILIDRFTLIKYIYCLAVPTAVVLVSNGKVMLLNAFGINCNTKYHCSATS